MESKALILGPSHHVKEKATDFLVDKISELPDDVLVAILSRLTIKESTTTSVLSQRWKNLWRFVPKPGCLNFDGTKILDDLVPHMFSDAIISPINIYREIIKFISWVDHVLNLHQGHTLEEFRVRFDICANFSSHVDNWIRFAMKQRVRRLVLDLADCMGYNQNDNYKFPSWALDNSIFDSLTDLRLSFVDVTGEVLEKLLYNCKGLERLYVKFSYSFVDLKISGISLKLKILELIHCPNIKSIDVCPVNLESFKFHGPKLSMPFKDFPPLSEAAFGGDFGEFVIDHFHQLSIYLSQLEKLSLDVIINTSVLHPRMEVFNFPVLGNLKHLELIVFARKDQSLLRFTSIIEACPLLHKFVLKIWWWEPSIEGPLLETPKCPHPCLKEVELVGFVGCTKDVEFVNFLLENAVSLQKIIFDPRSPHNMDKSWAYDTIANVETVRNCARQLEAKFPPGVDVIIL